MITRRSLSYYEENIPYMILEIKHNILVKVAQYLHLQKYQNYQHFQK